jgi:hypothetical protein
LGLVAVCANGFKTKFLAGDGLHIRSYVPLVPKNYVAEWGGVWRLFALPVVVLNTAEYLQEQRTTELRILLSPTFDHLFGGQSHYPVQCGGKPGQEGVKKLNFSAVSDLQPENIAPGCRLGDC